MEHVSSVRPTGKFPEKVENLKRWSRFPGWNFRKGMSCSIYVSRSLYQFQVHGRAPPRTGVYDQMEQLFTNRKFHFCYHRNFRVFFVNGKRPRFLQIPLGPLVTEQFSRVTWLAKQVSQSIEYKHLFPVVVAAYVRGPPMGLQMGQLPIR